MFKNSYNVIGVMSGTSLDGVDIAHINFRFHEAWEYRLFKAETVPYPGLWQRRLKEAVHKSDQELSEMNKEYTAYLGDCISGFINRHEITNVDAVCSHGHTVKHEPENAFTLQIGNLQELADHLDLLVVCDFRVQDVALGGQGAPLVPIGDERLFAKYTYCINLGGFANISYRHDNRRLAYDICPVNTVLNELAGRMKLAYDDKGAMAASGNVIPKLMDQLNELQYYKESPPKSLGIEWVEKHVFPLLLTDTSTRDLLRTYTEHVVEQIVRCFEHEEGSVLITGGGAHNNFLVERLKKITPMAIDVPSDELVNFKEAVVFGFLGVLKLRQENNVLASVTGAVRDHSSGKVFYPKTRYLNQ